MGGENDDKKSEGESDKKSEGESDKKSEGMCRC